MAYGKRRTALLTKGEMNAYAEIEYVQIHLDELEVAKNKARSAVNAAYSPTDFHTQ
jgi:hypothetical protein